MENSVAREKLHTLLNALSERQRLVAKHTGSEEFYTEKLIEKNTYEYMKEMLVSFMETSNELVDLIDGRTRVVESDISYRNTMLESVNHDETSS